MFEEGLRTLRRRDGLHAEDLKEVRQDLARARRRDGHEWHLGEELAEDLAKRRSREYENELELGSMARASSLRASCSRVGSRGPFERRSEPRQSRYELGIDVNELETKKCERVRRGWS